MHWKEHKRSKEQQRVFENIERLKKTTNLYISQATVAELKFGAEKSQSKTKNLARIEKLKKAIPELKVDDEVWDIFVKVKAELSQLGKSIATMDLLIAATAKRYDLILASNDGDMKNLDFLVENCVERESWAKND